MNRYEILVEKANACWVASYRCLLRDSKWMGAMWEQKARTLESMARELELCEVE